MDCERVRKSLLSDEQLDETALEHAKECEACRALVSDAGATGRRLSELDTSGSLPPLSFADVAPLIEGEQAPTAWLRNQSTAVRTVVAMSVGVVLAIATWLFTPRADLSVYPAGRMVLVITVLVVGIALCIRLSIWPAQLRMPRTRTIGYLLVAAVAVPFVLALLPAAHWALPLSREGVGDDWAHRAVACFSFGTFLAAPVLATLIAVDRGLSRIRTFALGAATLGLAGNLVLQLHCPLTSPEHLAAGHAGIGAAALVVLWVFGQLARR